MTGKEEEKPEAEPHIKALRKIWRPKKPAGSEPAVEKKGPQKKKGGKKAR